MNILYVTCSPRGAESESGRLGSQIIEGLLSRWAGEVNVRDLGQGPIARVDAAYARAQHSASANVAGGGSSAWSEELISELERADVLVIATPMHNLTVPVVLKAWIDHVVRASRTFTISAAGKVGTLKNRPVFIAIASGGIFSGEHPRQPDFLTPYLRAVLGTIGLLDVTFFTVEGTGRGGIALAQSRELSYANVGHYLETARLRWPAAGSGVAA